MGLQANPFFGYSFYSFPYCLHFRIKRYHWYQSVSLRWADPASCISRCVSQPCLASPCGRGVQYISGGVRRDRSGGAFSLDVVEGHFRRAGPVPANAAGYYVLTNVKPGTKLELRVRYQGATGSRHLSLAESDLRGDKPFDIVVQTRTVPPKKGPVAPTGDYSPPVMRVLS